MKKHIIYVEEKEVEFVERLKNNRVRIDADWFEKLKMKTYCYDDIVNTNNLINEIKYKKKLEVMERLIKNLFTEKVVCYE